MQIGQQVGVGGELEELLVPAALLDHGAVGLRQTLVLLPHPLFRDPELLHRDQQVVDRLLAAGGLLLLPDVLDPATDGRQPVREILAAVLAGHGPHPSRPTGRGRARSARVHQPAGAGANVAGRVAEIA